MSKHTPGPWDAPKEPNGRGMGWLAGPAWLGQDSYSEKTKADAFLIAASPDLLAVLKELQESAHYWSEYDVPLGIVDRINQAIAKAEGTQ